MDMSAYISDPNEKPLDRIVDDGGFTSIFRTIGCIGDSLSSGEFESTDPEGKTKGYHDYFEYSWGTVYSARRRSQGLQFLARRMTAQEYWDSFAEKNSFWDEDKLCQAYIIALGVNDLYGRKMELGSVGDIDRDDYNNNKPTFCGYYAKIIQRLKSMQPEARFFLMTMPNALSQSRRRRGWQTPRKAAARARGVFRLHIRD